MSVRGQTIERRSTWRTLTPWYEGEELAGLRVDGESIPFPGVGLESELGVVVPGARGIVLPALDQLLARRAAIPAAPWGLGCASDLESERAFDDLGASYREGDHLELNTWYHRSAAGARCNLERQLERAGALAAPSAGKVLLHATGTDGLGASWGSLHVNIATSERTFDRLLATQGGGAIAFGYYLPAQITLVVVDGNGGIGERGYLLSDRLGEFDAVFGSGTLRPGRAMLVERPEGFGCARIMNMLRALSFGAASVAGLAATQLDCLAVALMVHGAIRAEPLASDDPLEAARGLADCEQRGEMAAIQRRAQALRWSLLQHLDEALGAATCELLLPGLPAALEFIDATLDAIERDDEAELIQRCDWARKRALLEQLRESRGRSWHASLAELRQLNVHYARLDDRALRHRFPDARIPAAMRAATVPRDTSSWLLQRLIARAQRDEEWRQALFEAEIGWKGVALAELAWPRPGGQAWPWVRRRTLTLELVPWDFTERCAARVLASAGSLRELIEALGEERVDRFDCTSRHRRFISLFPTPWRYP